MKRVTALNQLRNGQRVLTRKPDELGTIKISYRQLQKQSMGPPEWVVVDKPAVMRPDIKRDVEFVPLKKGAAPQMMTNYWIECGVYVSSGPCKHCVLGLVRDRASGEHRSCKECRGSWFI